MTGGLIGIIILSYLLGKNPLLKIYLKSDAGDPASTLRQTFAYDNPKAGVGRFIHTYQCDGNPLPSFEGEPAAVELKGCINCVTKAIWNSLNEDNKVSLFVRFIDIETGEYETRIVNKNQ